MKDNCCVRKSTPLVPILSQMNLVHISPKIEERHKATMRHTIADSQLHFPLKHQAHFCSGNAPNL